MQCVLFGGDPNVESRSMPILKIRAGHTYRLRLLTHEPIWCSTHYLGRQYLCAGEGCPVCDGLPARVQGYVSIAIASDPAVRPHMLEFAPAAWERARFAAHRAGVEMAPGRLLTLTRGKNRGPIQFEVGAKEPPEERQVPTQKYLLAVIALVHGIRGPAVEESIEEWEQETRRLRNLMLLAALRKTE